MDLFTLDPLFRRKRFVENFESLIWTERYRGEGDITIDTPNTLENKNLLLTGTRLGILESKRVMEITKVLETVNEEGRATLRATGRSLEHILRYRSTKNPYLFFPTPTGQRAWSIGDFPVGVASTIFNAICRTGEVSTRDIIPFLVTGTLYPPDTLPVPGGWIPGGFIPWKQPLTTVYDALMTFCAIFDLGFRLYYERDASKLYFNIYQGSLRTSRQATLRPVIFSLDLGTLANTSHMTSIEDAYNVAHVVSPAGSALVYPVGLDPTIDGFDRRVLAVDAKDVTTGTAQEVQDALIMIGQTELAKHRSWTAFDGEVVPNNPYIYETDYYLGDVLEYRKNDGFVEDLRVTEQIFVSDEQGDRAYPTLAANTLLFEGTWKSPIYKRTWAEMGATEYWSNA